MVRFMGRALARAVRFLPTGDDGASNGPFAPLPLPSFAATMPRLERVSMAGGDYLITRAVDGKWMVRHDGRLLASFPEKGQALRAAIALANAAGSQGQEASVTGVDDGGLIYSIWIYGRDAFTTGE